MAGGMVVAASELVSPNVLFILLLCLLVYSFVFNRSRFATASVFLVVALVAACCFIVSAPNISPASINRMKDQLPLRDTSLIGRVSGFPEFRAYRSGDNGIWNFPLRCKRIQTSADWKNARGEVDVSIAGNASVQPVQYGQQIRVQGTFGKRLFPGGNQIELKIYSGNNLEILNHPKGISLFAWGRKLRDAGTVRLEVNIAGLSEQESVLKALVLGNRDEISRDILDRFRRTGTFHIFAISGLHVGIVGLLLLIILKTAGVPRDWFGLYLLPILALYVISTGMKSSALRALTMAGVFMLAPLFRRKPDVPSSVAFAAIVLLLFRPLEIQSAGFLFSFTVVAFIVMVYSVIPATIKQGGWIRSYSMGLIITSLAANLGSIPLSALYFGTFSPIALLGNLIVVPLTFLIVLSGWLAILVPFTTEIFTHAALFFVSLLLGSVTWLDALPGSSWQVNPPSLASVVLWYGSLIYLFTHATSRSQRVSAMAVAGSAVLLALLS